MPNREHSPIVDAVLASATCYLPLTADVLPTLKRGVVPLQPMPWSALPWLTATVRSESVDIREEDYQEYLRMAYQRLPATVAGLLTFEQFAQQAAQKRSEIEEELRRHRSVTMSSSPSDDWFVQRFFPDPCSLSAWQQTALGFASVWLAINEKDWPQARIQEVLYGVSAPASFPQRAYYDPVDNRHLEERRITLQRSHAQRVVSIRGQERALLRLPPKAIRGVLLGSELSADFNAEFVRFWRSDFRYQRIPVLAMVWDNGQLTWREEGAMA
ncbi:MAG: hypothetical protein IBX52_05570 [Bacterioplanes sp.]|nr:hypothetical protein [Bacterioplanes sp.]